MLTKRSRFIIMLVIVVAAVIMGIAGLILLPDTVITQVTLSGGNPSTMPKVMAVLLAFGLSVIFSIMYYLDEKGGKYLFISLVGIVVFIFTFVVNL